MQIVDRFSFARAEEILRMHHPQELAEVEAAIAAIDAESCRVKQTREHRRQGLLYSPIALNYCLLDKQLHQQGWDTPIRKQTIRHFFSSTGRVRSVALLMDGIKNRVGVESQLAKYAFLEYDVLAKMPIYQNLGLIDVGVEIVQMYRLSREMSSGVGDFERVVTNLVHRGTRAGDCPVLLLGIDVDPPGTQRPVTVRYEGERVPQLRGSQPGPVRAP